MQLSVVIPVRNDAVRLARCLESLIAGAAGSQIQIIVADNGSTDESRRVALEMGARVLELPGLGVSALRNEAAREATGEAVGFVDADHSVLPGWLRAATEILRDPQIGAAGAKYLSPPEGTWVQQIYGALRGRTIGAGETAWLGSGNLIVRRSAFHQVGGFDTSLEACEDVDLCQRMRAAGFRVIADERLGSIHYGDPPTLPALFRAERWRGRDNLRVSLRGPLALRDLPSVLIPVLLLAALLAFGAGLLISLAGVSVPWLVWLALGLIVVISLVRTAKIAAGLHRLSLATLAGAYVVSFVYDFARAAALITPAAHHRR